MIYTTLQHYGLILVHLSISKKSRFIFAQDLSLITWSHATNSHQELAEALTDGTMMIEADVSIGPNGEPIMAHPPATTSDLSLQQFLDIVIAVSKQVEKIF